MAINDLLFISTVFKVTHRAKRNGNHPFGSVLLDNRGNVLLEAEKTVVAEKDVVGHAEVNLVRMASRRYEAKILGVASIYSSTEPYPKYASAINYVDIRLVVYGLSIPNLSELLGDDEGDVVHLPFRELFSRGQRNIEVAGPLLEKEASQVHADFWKRMIRI